MRLFSLFKHKIYLAVILLVITLTIGVLGYKFIADYSNNFYFVYI